MAARLGNGIFGICKSFAALSLIFAVMLVVGSIVSQRNSATDIVGTVVFFSVTALISYLIGRAIRYGLARS